MMIIMLIIVVVMFGMTIDDVDDEQHSLDYSYAMELSGPFFLSKIGM